MSKTEYSEEQLSEMTEDAFVNIKEAYSTINTGTRVNNLIAILESDEVISHIVNDEKNQLEFKSLYSNVEKNIFNRIFTKKTIIDKDYIKTILSENFKVKDICGRLSADLITGKEAANELNLGSTKIEGLLQEKTKISNYYYHSKHYCQGYTKGNVGLGY